MEPDASMPINEPVKKKSTLLAIARIFATLLAIMFLIALAPKLIDHYMAVCKGEKPMLDSGWGGIVMELTLYIFLIGYGISWWRKCAGGVIILVASLVQMAPFLIIEGNMGSLIFGIPLLVAGLLFVTRCGK
jgi:hypothetical protein